MTSAEPWLADPLGHLIGAERVSDFFARVYEREALVAAHNEPARFASLVSIADVDTIITTQDLREGRLDLANAARELSRSDYVDTGGYIDRGAVAELYRDGSTIILQQAHQLGANLAVLCRALEHVFSSHVQTNLYLTPANAQGFRTHYDNHDVFVLQVSGEKAWRLYDMPVETPYRGEPFRSDAHPTGALRHEFVLKAGDCAYVPRGLMHDAQTSGDAPSLHITVGLITRTWADLMLEAVSEVALRHQDFRRSLPPGFARGDFDRTEAAATLQRLMQTAAREAQLDPALDLMIDTFIRSRGANNEAAILDAPRAIGADERFALRPFTHSRLAEDGDALVLIIPGGELAFTTDQRGAIERVLSGAPFTPAELGVEAAEKIVGRLLAHGMVARA